MNTIVATIKATTLTIRTLLTKQIFEWLKTMVNNASGPGSMNRHMTKYNLLQKYILLRFSTLKNATFPFAGKLHF
jgi:hypothetical protein